MKYFSFIKYIVVTIIISVIMVPLLINCGTVSLKYYCTDNSTLSLNYYFQILKQTILKIHKRQSIKVSTKIAGIPLQ